MKRRKLIKHLAEHGCYLRREGGRHSIYKHSTNNKQTAVPRHSEIKDRLAVKICKDLEIPSIK